PTVERRARDDDLDLGLGSRGWGVVGKTHGDLDRLAAAVGGLSVDSQIHPAQPATGQVADHLDPKLVEAQLVFAETPAPGLVEAEEHAAAATHELLDEQGMSVFAGSRCARRGAGAPL